MARSVFTTKLSDVNDKHVDDEPEYTMEDVIPLHYESYFELADDPRHHYLFDDRKPTKQFKPH